MPDKFDGIPRETHNNFPGLPRSSRASDPKKNKKEKVSRRKDAHPSHEGMLNVWYDYKQSQR